METIVFLFLIIVVCFGLPFVLMNQMNNAVIKSDEMRGRVPDRGKSFIIGLTLIFSWVAVLFYFFVYYLDRNK